MCASSMPDFRAAVDLLSRNRAIYRVYQDSVYCNLSDVEWMEFMQRRAVVYRGMYGVNSAAIASMLDYFGKSTTPVPDAAYDSLYTVLSDKGDAVLEDVFILEEFTDIMQPHYKELADTARLMQLNHYSGIYNTDIARSYEIEAASRALSSFKANFDFSHSLQTFTPAQVDMICLDYAYVCLVLAGLGAVSPHETLELTNDFESFFIRHGDVLPPDARMKYRNNIQLIRSTSFRTFTDTDNDWMQTDSVTVKQMFEESPFCRGGLEVLRTAEDTICYYLALTEMGKMSAGEAYRESNAKLFEQFDEYERYDTISENELMAIGNCLISTFVLMDKCPDLGQGYKMQSAVFYIYRLVDLVKRVRIAENYVFFDYVLSQLASNKVIMRYLPTGMKEQFLSDLAVRLQVGTVVHVSIVEMMCEVMLDGLLDDCPEAFVGVLGTRNEAEVQAARGQLKHYMSYAALFHDIGKTQMGEIVSNDFRRMNDHEYAIIKKHPEYSLKYFDLDPLFDKYKDVALGHHRWYNGKGGYPAWFDNTSSPWRPMIDLLTICDCIDAATDFLGRNYRMPKTLAEVIAEFQAGAGTRYNPVMVEALAKSEQMQERLNHIIKEDRTRKANEVRQLYINRGL